jgi:ABC-2 type transport system permease protein
MRLFTTPLSASDYILGYTLWMIPISVLQSLICFIAAIFLGLKITIDILLALVVLIPAALLFIGFGLFCGTVFSDKQVGGICGALLTNLCAWLSGTWFDLELVGGWFKKIAYALPFAHAVNACRAALSGDYSKILPDLLWVIGYAVVIFVIAVFTFRAKMKGDKE